MGNTLVIAEAGANHNKDKSLAFELINVAAKSKCDIVKFQTYSSETLYAKGTPDFAGYKDVNKLIDSIALPRHWQKDLKTFCDDAGIEFMSTPFDESAVDELFSLGVKRFKISGFECTDPRFVKYVASTKLPLIISLGIGTTLQTMKEVYSWVLKVNSHPDITFLHCNNAYPTPHQDLNLGHMQNMIKENDNSSIRIGLSDHTEGILAPPIAVALGAKAIEKHFTLDRRLPGPDHPFAIEPNQLFDMVKSIRLTETMLGSKSSLYTSSEEGFSKARRSVVVKGSVSCGSVITEDTVTTKRPLLTDSIPATEYYKILGKKFNKSLEGDHILRQEDVT